MVNRHMNQRHDALQLKPSQHQNIESDEYKFAEVDVVGCAQYK